MKSGIWCTNKEYTPLSSGAFKTKSEVLDDLNLFKECNTFEEFSYKWNPEWSIRTDYSSLTSLLTLIRASVEEEVGIE